MSVTAPKRLPGAAGPSPLRTPPAGATAIAKGAPAKGNTKARTYDYTQVATDFTAIRTIRQQFDQDNTLVFWQQYMQTDPDQPYLKVLGEDGTTNTAIQVVDPTATVLVDKCCAYNLSGELAIRIPPERNGATAHDIGLAEEYVSFVWYWNEMTSQGTSSQFLRHWYLNMTGTYVAQYSYLDKEDAQDMLSGFPIMVTLHDPTNVAYEHDATGLLSRVIVAKRMLYGELPAAARTDASKADDLEVQAYEHYDRINYALIVDSEVVLQYPHAYVNLQGMPMVPFVIQLHDPITTRLGNIGPILTAGAPREMVVGRGPWFGMIPLIKLRSFFLTAQRHNIREYITAWHVVEGQAIPDWNSKTVTIAKVNEGKFSMVEPPNVLGDIDQGLQTSQAMLDSSGAAPGVLGGQIPQTASGVAVNAGTSLPRQKFASVLKSHCQGLQKEALMALAIAKSNTTASTARRFQKATGHPLAVYGSQDMSPHFKNSGSLPGSHLFTGGGTDAEGNPNVPFDPLTLEGIYYVEVGMQPTDSLPKETAIQVAMNLWGMQNQKIPDDMIYGDLFGVTNPESVKDRLAYESLEKDPSLPFGQFRAIRAALHELAGNPNVDPTQLQGLTQQADQMEGQLSLAALSTKLQQLQQGGTGAPPQPGAPPSPGAPPAGPPQGPPGGPPPPPQGILPQGVPGGGPPITAPPGPPAGISGPPPGFGG